MSTVKELSEKMHISVRTLHYYDEIGLLKPELRTEQGFRAYDKEDEARLKMILGFRELGFSLKKIRELLSVSAEARNTAIEEQINILEHQCRRIENRIALARGIQMLGSRGFQELNMYNLDAEMESARKLLEKNEEIRLFREKTENYAPEEWERISHEMIRRFAGIGACGDEHIKESIMDFADFIDEYFMPCDNRILTNYAKMLGGDGIFGREVDALAGEGTAAKARERILCFIGANEDQGILS